MRSTVPSGDVPPAVPPPAVDLEGVAVGYGGQTVLRDLSLTVPRGSFVGIVGPSGSGKTTLLRLLTGRAARHQGRVEVLGRAVQPSNVPAGVGYVPQLEAVDWEFPVTVEQVVLLGEAATSAPVPWFSRGEKQRARALLERLGLGGLERRRIRELSGGQRQRMFLARALLRDAELLLLDEPTSGVDLATRRDVLELLGQLHHEGLTVVLTTHDLNFVAAHLPRVVCLNQVITADGPPAEVLTPDALQRTFGAPLQVLRDGDRIVVVDAEQVELHDAAAHRRDPVHHDPARHDPSRHDPARHDPARQEDGPRRDGRQGHDEVELPW